MTARNPMAGWQTCPHHGTPFQDPDSCPDCAAHAAQARRPGLLAALWRIIRGHRDA